MLMRAATVVQVLQDLVYVLLHLLVVAAIIVSLIASFIACFILLVIAPTFSDEVYGCRLCELYRALT